jgi:FkbM family methyltransferase
MRQIQYKWLRKTWTLNLHPPGDSICDLFKPPEAMDLLPWILSGINGTFVDIGAHIGTIAVHAAPFFQKVVAFEPEPRNLACLRKNVTGNRLPNVTIIPKAVSDTCGVSTFYVNDSVDTGRNSLYAREGGTSFDVEIVTVDSVFSGELSAHPPIAFIKIDIEGFEPKAIRGAAATLARQQARPVMKVEFTPLSWSKNEADVYWLFDYLKQIDYVPMLPTSGFVSPVTVDTLAQIYESWKGLHYDSWLDILLVPKELSTEDAIKRAWAKVRDISSSFAT